MHYRERTKQQTKAELPNDSKPRRPTRNRHRDCGTRFHPLSDLGPDHRPRPCRATTQRPRDSDMPLSTGSAISARRHPSLPFVSATPHPGLLIGAYGRHDVQWKPSSNATASTEMLFTRF